MELIWKICVSLVGIVLHASQIEANGGCSALKLDKEPPQLKANLDKLNSLPTEIRNHGYSVEVREGNSDYIYTLKICPDSNVKDNGSITQLKKGDAPETATIIGRMNETVAHFSDLGDLVYLSYTNGDDYRSACNQSERRATTLIRCIPGLKEPTMKYFSEMVADKEDFCYYLFELWLPPNHLPGIMNCNETKQGDNGNNTPPTSHHLSAGSIILILILVPGVLFFILGALYKRFVMGAIGIEQVPCIDFWRNCGTLQAAGWRYLRGGCRSRSHNNYDEYSAVSTEDEREILDATRTNDDHLLPM